MDPVASLGRALPALSVSTLEVDRLAYARDLWPRQHLDVRDGSFARWPRPVAVAWPTSTADVAALVRWAASEGVPLVPFGAGSGVCAGVAPDARTVVVDLKKMSRWRAFDPSAPSLDVEAGALGITLEEELARRGFTLGHFPSSILCSTVGGWVAARSAGQCSGLYGKIEDMIASLEVVLGDGEVVTLHRRTAGLDLASLVVGSEGTMGVVTSAKLRLHPAPAARGFAAFSFPTTEAGWEAMRAMFQAGLRPAVSRLYDPFDSFLANQGKVKSTRAPAKPKAHASTPGAGAIALRAMLRAPRLLNGFVTHVGDRVFGGAMLVLVFEGTADETAADVARASALAGSIGGRALGEGPARRWLAHRYGVSYRQAPMFRMGAFTDTMEVAAPWSRLRDLYEGVRRALAPHVFVMAHLSHAYPDGCSIYFTFAGAAADDDACRTLYDAAWRTALDAVIAAGGTISHHHGVGRSKAPRMRAEHGASLEVVRALLSACDPAGILNPGNLVPPREPASPAPAAPAPATEPLLDERSGLVRAPGAMTLADLEAWLAPSGFTLGLAADAPLALSVAEWLAAGAAGAPSPWLDPADHLVAGLTGTLRGGRPLTVHVAPRRAVGPDLIALLDGAGGRFGTLDDATLRVSRTDAPRARPHPTALTVEPAVEPGEEAFAARLGRALDAVG